MVAQNCARQLGGKCDVDWWYKNMTQIGGIKLVVKIAGRHCRIAWWGKAVGQYGGENCEPKW